MEKNFYDLQEMLQITIKEHSSKASYGFVGQEAMSWQEFGKEVENYSQLLAQKGIGYGDKVALISPNMPQWCVAYYSIINLGAVVVPILTEFSEHEMLNIIEHSEAKAIFVHQKFEFKLKELKNDNILVLEISEGETIRDTNINIENPSLFNKVEPSDLAAIIYTSGTTGKSKGVMLSHKNMVSQLDMLYALQPITSDDVFLSILPLPHVLEASLSFLYSAMKGSSVYYLDKPPVPSVLMPAFKTVRPTIMLTVPLIIEKIFKSKIYPELTKSKFMRLAYSFPPMRKFMHRKASAMLQENFGGRVRFFGIGGAKLDKNVERFLLEGKFPYAIGYGLTETAPLIAGANPQMVKWQSTGPSVKNVELKIDNPDPKTGEGEIWAKGDNVMLGYYKDEELTREVLTENGWFKTGDIGTFDKNGWLFMKSRLKNVIIGANGENIYPEDIEIVINSHNVVSESLVIEHKGRLVALVNFNVEEIERKYEELKDNLSQKVSDFKQEFDIIIEKHKEELIKYVNSRVSKSSMIFQVVSINSDFDKTPTQKIKRYLYANPKLVGI
ncbi:MAG: long-chain fatty acid--CoA ligase [Bacteroidales bacterium]|jgi:long-chain acyl-CoA synthetase|nr:long-chain fatty acid--CoA ligase [Bacteroidales bacterium]